VTDRSDGDLMRAFARRERAAAEELYRAFAPRIYGLGMVLLGDKSAAEDLVQDTMVKTWRNAERYDEGRGSLETWLLRIARNLAVDVLRRRVLESRHGGGTESVWASRPDPSAGPEERAETADLVDRARAAMRALSDEQRAALELAYFGGRTSAEVAELEGIPLGTVKTRIRRALMKLRGSMEAEREL
jgi:RNA polymerase sigma-70 factor (ECF subfamily)